ncbi:MAG: rhodanese-like domain-containing protein [Chloroflexota bacterium]
MKCLKVVTVVFLAIILGLAALGGCSWGGEAAIPGTEARIIRDVTPPQAFTLIKENEGNPGFIILDVRTPREFAEGHIAQAVNLDYNSKNFGDSLGRLDKNLVYLVYCRTGVRSAAASALMAKNGFNKVYNMTGGITDWQAAGLATVK